MTGESPSESIQFQLAVPPELAAELTALPGVVAEITGDAPARVQHELALETIALVVAIAVNAQDLAPTCKKIADTIHGFFSRSKQRDPRVKVVGERE